MWRIRTTFVNTDNGDTWLNTTHWADSIGLSVTGSAYAVAQMWDDCCNYIGTGITIQVDPIVDVVDVATGTLTGTVTVATDDFTGRSTTAMLPYQTQCEIALLTGDYVSGRQVVGRFIVPGLTTEANNGGVPSTTALAVFKAAVDDNKNGTGIYVDNASMKVYSKTHHSIHDLNNTRSNTRFTVLRSRRS